MSATGTQTDDVIGPVILLARATRVVAMYRGSTDQSTQTQLRWLRSAGRWQLGDDSEESEEDGDESATDSEAETPSDTEAESEAGAVEVGRWQLLLTPILEAELAVGSEADDAKLRQAIRHRGHPRKRIRWLWREIKFIAWKRWKRLVELTCFYDGIRRPVEHMWGYLLARERYRYFFELHQKLLRARYGKFAVSLASLRPRLVNKPMVMAHKWNKVVSQFLGRMNVITELQGRLLRRRKFGY